MHQVGDQLAPRTLTTTHDLEVRLPARTGLTHLQLRRFAGCPICNLHLQSVMRRRDELINVGVEEIIVFPSRRENLLKYHGDIPFHLIADPKRALYTELDARRSLAAVGPAAMGAMARGVRAASRVPLVPDGSAFQLPVDVMLRPDGTIVDIQYGRHADDQWTVEEILERAKTHGVDASHGVRP